MGTEGLQDRYINPYTDFGFKLLFGTAMNKEVLINFLNALLLGKEVIKDVTYLNTEHLGTQEYDRRAVFDVYCENDRGEKILVEMQRGEQQFFKDRSIYYATFPIHEQAPRGEWDYELKGVYIIGILNFIFQDGIADSDHYHHQVQLVELRTKEVLYDKLTFIYLEMPKFNKTEAELETIFDKWMFVLRNLSNLQERPLALQECVFNRLFQAAEIAAFNPQQRSEYWDSLKSYRDWKNVLDTNMKKSYVKGREEGREEGLAKGREEGLAKGREEGREEGLSEGMEKGEVIKAEKIARKMKEMGFSMEEIQQATGLTMEQLDNLN